MKRALLQSILLHLFILGLLWHPSQEPSISKRPSLLKVDMVALPNRLKHDLPAINPHELNQKAKEQERLEAKKQIKAFQKEQLMERIRGWAKESEADQKALKAEEEAKAEILHRGNTLSAGSSLLGSLQVEIETQYADTVRDRLHQHFELPLYLQQRKDLSAKVTLWIHPDGTLRHFQFDAPSKDAHFNESIERSIRNSAPFPPIPKAAHSRVRNGLSFAFPL
jgi:outer membrane biosynthesis protein TonB